MAIAYYLDKMTINEQWWRAISYSFLGLILRKLRVLRGFLRLMLKKPYVFHSFLRLMHRKPFVLRGFLRPMLRKPRVLHGFLKPILLEASKTRYSVQSEKWLARNENEPFWQWFRARGKKCLKTAF